MGIFTFTQLAALSPADVAAAIAGLSGVSSERIVKQDWIGQAHRLAAELLSSKAQEKVEPASVPPDPREYPHVGTPLEEPQHTPKPVPEPISSEVQEEDAISADTEQFITFTAPFEPPADVKHTPATLRSVDSEKFTTLPSERYHPATFTIEILLDDNNNVHSTHVLHVQSRREYIWSDWPGAELVDFLGQSAGVTFASDEPILANTEEPEQAPALATDSGTPTSVGAKPALAGTLHLREIKVLTDGSSEPCRLLPRDQPFDVCLTLDLSELTVPSNSPLNYKASICRKSRQFPSGQVIREAEGTIKPADTVTIDLKGTLFPGGSYRLAATVALALPDTEPTSQPDLVAEIEGYRVRVF